MISCAFTIGVVLEARALHAFVVTTSPRAPRGISPTLGDARYKYHPKPLGRSRWAPEIRPGPFSIGGQSEAVGGLSREERAALNIPDGLVRLSVGLEDPADIRDDLARVLEVVRSAAREAGSSTVPLSKEARVP